MTVKQWGIGCRFSERCYQIGGVSTDSQHATAQDWRIGERLVAALTFIDPLTLHLPHPGLNADDTDTHCLA
jgi:hypothetical protein